MAKGGVWAFGREQTPGSLNRTHRGWVGRGVECDGFPGEGPTGRGWGRFLEGEPPGALWGSQLGPLIHASASPSENTGLASGPQAHPVQELASEEQEGRGEQEGHSSWDPYECHFWGKLLCARIPRPLGKALSS